MTTDGFYFCKITAGLQGLACNCKGGVKRGLVIVKERKGLQLQREGLQLELAKILRDI